MSKELPQGYRLGDYSIERLLTRNGLQTAYAAKQLSSARTCLLIVFNVNPTSESWQRFKSELGQLTALGHPSIAECLGVESSADGLAYAAWAQPAGEDLATRLRRGGALTLRESLILSRQLGAALHAAHRSEVLHRALIPENIYFVSPSADAPAPEYEQVLLYGFGIARLFEGELSGVALVDHPEYMALEQITGLPFDVGPAADQYALALIVYQVLSASQPFRAESAVAALLKVVRSTPEPLRALRPDLPTHVEAAVTRALARERQARFPDLPAFIAALTAGEKIPQALIAATEPWLGGSNSTDEALSRALAAGSVTPSLGVVAQGLGAHGAGDAGVPQVVEDSATVPNTMESVMRLAVPPEQLAAMPSEPTELNLEPLEPTPPPSVSKGMPGVPERRDSPSQPSGRLRAGGNNLAMRSGETSGLIKKDGISAEVEIPEERDTVIIKGDQGIKPPASERERPAPAAPAPSPLQSALSRFLPLALAPHAPRIESVLYLVVGLLFGFLFRGCFK